MTASPRAHAVVRWRRAASRVLRHTARLAALTPQRRRLAVEAVLALGIARALILAVPIRVVVRRLERRNARLGAPGPDAGGIAREVGWAVRAAAPKTPWDSACLAQALAGKWMLARRGVASTIRLGVARDPSGELRAHAWLRAGDLVLTGGREARQFKSLGDLS